LSDSLSTVHKMSKANLSGFAKRPFPRTVDLTVDDLYPETFLLRSGESNKDQDFGGLYLQLVCRRTLPLLLETACNGNDNNSDNDGDPES
jgi:hypothetical protein